jgi:hypothetical protein
MISWIRIYSCQLPIPDLISNIIFCLNSLLVKIRKFCTCLRRKHNYWSQNKHKEYVGNSHQYKYTIKRDTFKKGKNRSYTNKKDKNLSFCNSKSICVVIFRLKMKRLALCFKGFKVGFFKLLDQEKVRISCNRGHNKSHHGPRQFPENSGHQSRYKAQYPTGSAQDKKVADGFKKTDVTFKHNFLQFLCFYSLKYSIFLSLHQIKRNFL